MPQDLAALLVEVGAVSKADVARAVARQAQLGGALDTALLELGLIGEGKLLSLLSDAGGLPAVPAAAFSDLDPRARRVFPAKVAERHRLAPFALDGRELSVAAVHPVDAAAIDEIGFMLSLTLVPHVGPEWRVLELIQRLYGGQLPARFAKLAEEAGPPPAAEVPSDVAAESPPSAPPPAPPSSTAEVPPPSSLSIEDAFFAAGEAGTFTPAPVAPPAPPPEEDEGNFGDVEPARTSPSGFGRDDSEPAEPLLAALEQAVDAFDALSIEVEPPSDERPTEEEPAAAALPGGGGAEAGIEPAAAGAGPTIAPGEPQQEELEPEEPAPVNDRSAPPRWSVEEAAAALAATRHRDDVVLTALRYARDSFEFSALFAVTRDAVVGHDALGVQEDARSRCRGTAIYATDPGVVKTVLETRAPYLGHASRDAAGTANILDGLWRGTPRTVLLYPILVGEKPVAVLYADNGEAPVSPRRLGDLLLFLSSVGGNFERIIRARKKRKPSAAPRPSAPPPDDDPPPRAAGEGEREAKPVAPEGAPPAQQPQPIVDLALDPTPDVGASASPRRAGAGPLPERLRLALLSGVGERPLLAARALGALRDVESIPILIQALESGTPETAEAAAEALATITLQRLGPSPQGWLRWWKDNRGRSRAEWLFAALTSADRDLRLAASGELRSIAQPPVRYSVDLPAAELDAAARAWWGWWSRQGIKL
ncbi:MAG: hypothetical protein WCC48_14855 [Anaeromyxobacteraceae bacterium]